MFEKQLKSPLRSPLMRAILAGSGVSTPSYYLNLSSPSNVTIADGQANGTITSTHNAVITASMSPSRTTGVAPLYVNFDMTGTTSTDSTNPTHECFFATDFGDSGAGTWANGVQSAGLTSKNAGYGPVTGHVYETPGTYTVSMSVTDGVNTVTKTGTIVVQDPDVVYAGTATICISHSGNFTGAPAGATQVNTSGNTDMYAAFNTYKASNKRILFCKADSWTCSATMEFSNITNMTVGGYGAGVAAGIGSGTMVSVTPAGLAGASMFLPGTGNTDIKLCNFRINSNYDTLGCGLYNTIVQMLYYKVEFRNGQQGFNAYPGGGGTDNIFDQHCMYECLVDSTFGYAGVNAPTASASGAIGTPGVFTATAHPFKANYKVRLTGTPPAPLATLTDYYVSSISLAANTFTLSSTNGGAALALSGTGTCTVTAQNLAGGIGAFVGFVRGGMMGCYFDNNNHGEQTVRFPFLNRAHINNNYFARPNQGKNVIKIHSFVYLEVAKYTEKFILSGNVIDLRGGYSYNTTLDGATITTVGDPAIIISNGGSSGYEKTRNGIIENNYTQGCLGNPKDAMAFSVLGGPNMTVRNNIYDASVNDRTLTYEGDDTYTNIAMAAVSSSTDDPTTGIRIYNNTLYSNLANAEVASFVTVNQPTNVTASGAIGTPGVFTSVGSHYMVSGTKCRLASGTPPAPLSLGVDYWVTATSLASTTFTLSATNGGAALALFGTGTCVVYRGAEVDSLTIQNNLWYLPFHNLANPRGAYRNAGMPAAAPTNVTADHNTDNNGGSATDPHFSVQPPVTLADWRPTTGYAVSGGATVPVLRDFNNASRYGATYDLGAVLP